MVDDAMWMVQDKAARLVREARAVERKAQANGMSWRQKYQNQQNAIQRANKEIPELPNKIAELRKLLESERENLGTRLREQQTAGDRLKTVRQDYHKIARENAEREAVVRELDDKLRERLDPYFRERQKRRKNAYMHYTHEQLSERFRNDILAPLVAAAEAVAGEQGGPDEPPYCITKDVDPKQAVKGMWAWLEKLFPSEVFWKGAK